MLAKKIITPIDTIVDFIKSNNTNLSDIIKLVKERESTIERWLYLLEEKGIIKTVGSKIIYVENLVDEDFDFFDLKNSFFQKSKNKNFQYEQIQTFWIEYISKNNDELYIKFKEIKKNKDHTEYELKKAWEMFKKDLEIL